MAKKTYHKIIVKLVFHMEDGEAFATDHVKSLMERLKSQGSIIDFGFVDNHRIEFAKPLDEDLAKEIIALNDTISSGEDADEVISAEGRLDVIFTKEL